MERTTIMLNHDLKVRASKQARKMGLSLGEFIRKSVENALKSDKDDSSLRSDTLFDDDAIFPGKIPADLSRCHDEYLYEDRT